MTSEFSQGFLAESSSSLPRLLSDNHLEVAGSWLEASNNTGINNLDLVMVKESEQASLVN